MLSKLCMDIQQQNWRRYCSSLQQKGGVKKKTQTAANNKQQTSLKKAEEADVQKWNINPSHVSFQRETQKDKVSFFKECQ